MRLTDVVQGLEFVHLPTHKRVVVRVRWGRDKAPSPVDSASKVGDVLLGDGWEVGQPVSCVGELLDVLTRHPCMNIQLVSWILPAAHSPMLSIIWNW